MFNGFINADYATTIGWIGAKDLFDQYHYHK
jgi:hypothetical protein